MSTKKDFMLLDSCHELVLEHTLIKKPELNIRIIYNCFFILQLFFKNF